MVFSRHTRWLHSSTRAASARRRDPARRPSLALAGGTLAALALSVAPDAASGGAAARLAHAPAPSTADGLRVFGVPAHTSVPITGVYPQSREGILPPANPPSNIPPSPNFLSSCSGSGYDDSAPCVEAATEAIDNARSSEGLPAMMLPTDWGFLTPQEQLFTVTNLERTVRGLPPLSGMATALDASAAQAASSDRDPAPPSGFAWTTWGSNWAAGVGNPLEVVYYWMYDDGSGSSNVDCTAGDSSGCWGHRDNVLLGLGCKPCVAGVGYAAGAWQGEPSWTEMLVDTSGSPALDYSWGSVLPYLAGSPGGAGLLTPAVGMAATPDGNGYWLVDASGGVFTFGDAQFYGSMSGNQLAAPIVGITSTPDGHGYWLVASDGGIFTYGDAGFYGSAGDIALAKPVVGMSATPDGHGYWLVASDGGIFTYGDAGFFGSAGDIALAKPVVAMSATPDGHGYWLVASDGGIFTFGDAPFRGSTGAIALSAPMVSIATPSLSGYWLAAADGGIFSFGLPFHGSMG